MAARGFEGYVPEVTLDFFKSSVLPHQPEDTIAKLDGAVASFVNSEWDCWKDFLLASDPKDVEDEIEEVEKEDVFAAFPGLLNEIVTNVTSVLGRRKEEVTFEAVASSNEHLDSEDDVEEDFKVDAFAALRKRTQPLPSTSAAAADASADEDSTRPPSRFSQQAADALFVCALKKGARRKDILRVSLEPVVSHSSLLYD